MQSDNQPDIRSPIDLETLSELYPDAENRRHFLQRVINVLRADRDALWDTLADAAFTQAAELVHRLQGTASVLSGTPETAAAVFHPLYEALRCGDATHSHVRQDAVFKYLQRLELALLEVVDTGPQRS